MTTVYLVRHGQSIGNKLGRFLGQTDLDLSELGYKQAELLRRYFEGIAVDVVYSSDLIRAVNTVLPIARDKSIPLIPDQRLREISCGKWENQPFEDLKSIYKADYDVWLSDIGNARCTGGESVAELLCRIKSVIEKIAAENDGKSVVIGTHATPIRCMTAYLRGLPITAMKDIAWVSNASVTKVVYSNGVGKITDYAYDGHLGQIKSAFSGNV